MCAEVDAASSLGTESRAAPDAGGPVAELPRVGDVIGRYALRGVLGSGGMGTVYEAEHLVLQKRVALKVLNPDLAASADLRQRFVREGLAASRVRHPHVVDVTDAAEEDGRAYLVMELLSGHGLDVELARRGKLEMGRASEIILPICAALAEAHAVGVVHRDMKPENVLLVRSAGDRIVPKVLDFGISDLIGGSPSDIGVVLGTPHYMAPEQACGQPVGGLADQYAVAVMLFELLTGRLPYDLSRPKDTSKLLADVAAGHTHRLRDFLPNAPERLEAVIARAMAADPRQRLRTMERFGRALLPFASPRAIRRYRDLVDPGWSAMLPAVGAMMHAGASPLPPVPEAPSSAQTLSEAPSMGGAAIAPPLRQADMLELLVPRTETATVDQTWRRPVRDTLASPPPELWDEPSIGPHTGSRPRIVSHAQTLRWSSVPPPPAPPAIGPILTEPPSAPSPPEPPEPPTIVATPSRPRRDVRLAAITAGAVLAIASIAFAAIATTLLP